MSLIKEYWGQITVAGAIILIIGTALLEWRVQQNVSQAGVLSPSEIAQLREDISELEAEDEKLDGKIERIVGILLEE